ncbi:MAG: vWA domain-containing protein, partial [Planctomyces sp.]
MIHLSLWLLVAAPILLLHLRGSAIAGRHSVSSVNLWDHVSPELGSASGRRRIRDVFSLILHLLIAAVLISMLSLLSADSDREGSDHVVILDTSPGMTANDAGVQRFDLARKHALKFLRTLPPGDPVALIDTAAEPRVVCRKTVDKEMFISAITALQASDGSSSPDVAVRLGKRILTEQSNARPSERSIVMVTDGCGDFEWLSKSPENGVEWILVGTEDAPNSGITSFQTRRRLNAPEVCDAFCRLNNSGNVPAELWVDLHLDDELIDSIPCQIDAHSSATKEIRFRDRDGGHLRLSIRRPADPLNLPRLEDDSLQADDFAEQELEPVPVIPITLVSSENRYLRAALESLPEVRLRIQEKVPDSMEAGEIVFLHKWVPENLPGGRIVVIDPQSATDLWKCQGRMVQPRLQVLDTEHQRCRDIS